MDPCTVHQQWCMSPSADAVPGQLGPRECMHRARWSGVPAQAMPEKADTPSNFTLKLRKHIRRVGLGTQRRRRADGCVCSDAPPVVNPPGSATMRAAGRSGPAQLQCSAPRCKQCNRRLPRACRTRRLEAVKQLGVDRIVQLTFGSGAAACHLLLEFYAQAGLGRGCQQCGLAACGPRVGRLSAAAAAGHAGSVPAAMTCQACLAWPSRGRAG